MLQRISSDPLTYKDGRHPSADQLMSYQIVLILVTLDVGRPRFIIPREQLESLVEGSILCSTHIIYDWSFYSDNIQENGRIWPVHLRHIF